MPLIPKQVVPVETDSNRADKINNCVVRSLSQIRTCIERTNKILAGGDKAAIVEAFDAEVIAALDSLAAFVCCHTADSITNDLGVSE